MNPEDFLKIREEVDCPSSFSSLFNQQFKKINYVKLKSNNFKDVNLFYFQGGVQRIECLSGSTKAGFLGRFQGFKRGILEIYALNDSNKILGSSKEYYSEGQLNPLNEWRIDDLVVGTAKDLAYDSGIKTISFCPKRGFAKATYSLNIPTEEGIKIEEYTFSDGKFNLEESGELKVGSTFC